MLIWCNAHSKCRLPNTSTAAPAGSIQHLLRILESPTIGELALSLQDPFPVGFDDSAANRSCAVVPAAVAAAGGRDVKFVRPQNGQLGGILGSLGAHKEEALSANGTSAGRQVLSLPPFASRQWPARHFGEPQGS